MRLLFGCSEYVNCTAVVELLRRHSAVLQCWDQAALLLLLLLSCQMWFRIVVIVCTAGPSV